MFSNKSFPVQKRMFSLSIILVTILICWSIVAIAQTEQIEESPVQEQNLHAWKLL